MLKPLMLEPKTTDAKMTMTDSDSFRLLMPVVHKACPMTGDSILFADAVETHIV
jgi:hypothetical protein